MNRKIIIRHIRQMIANAESNRKDSHALAYKFEKTNFELSVLADEAAWAIMYHQRSLTSILEELESQDEASKGRNKKKPQVRRRSRVGNGNVLKNTNN